MVTPPPKLAIWLAKDSSKSIPFLEYLESETDAKVRAKILSKIEMIAAIPPDDYPRSLVDTLDGPIKELRADKQPRILFSAEQEKGLLLFYGGERKKSRGVSSGLIEDAKKLREAWLDGRKATKLDMPALKREIQRKRIKWPK